MSDAQRTHATKIRTITYELDARTNAQSVLDIRECHAPARTEASSWTALARDSDAAKRGLLLDLARQIDMLVAGEIDEVRIFACE